MRVKRVRVVVTGRVQGVFYRATCLSEARARALAGWVKNTRDGRVEAAFEGADEVVDDMLAWCRVGPPSARVDEVESWLEAPQGEDAFRVVG